MKSSSKPFKVDATKEPGLHSIPSNCMNVGSRNSKAYLRSPTLGAAKVSAVILRSEMSIFWEVRAFFQGCTA